MTDYLNGPEKSTDVVNNKNKLSKFILVASYLIIWTTSIIAFWFFTSGSDAMGYGIIYLWLLLPIATFVCSLLIGMNNYWGRWKWISVLVFGVMYMFAEYATFSAANMISFSKITLPEFSMFLIGIIISVAGLGIGVGMNFLKRSVRVRINRR